MPEPVTLQLPTIDREARVAAVRAADPGMRGAGAEVDVVWTTGALVQRRRWEGWDDLVEYDEELVVNRGSIRLGRLNDGAPFLDSHNGWSLASVIGTIKRGSVRIENGQGTATIVLTSAEDAAPAVQRILDGTISSVSVGYRVWRYEITKKDGARELWRAVDWEPLEISAVPIPADPGAKIRADDPREPALTPCVLIRTDAPPASAAHPTRNDMTDQTATDLGRPQETRAADPTPAAPTAPAPAPDPAAEATARAADILGLCARHNLPTDFAGDLVRRCGTVDQARAAILDRLAADDAPGARRSEPTVPAAARSAGDGGFSAAITEALMHRHSPAANPLTAAGREFRGMTLLEIGRSVLERQGRSARGLSKMELAGELFRNAGYHSTDDFPFILANIATKTLRAAYDGTPRTFTAWARRTTVPDFKQVQRTQLGGAPSLIAVPESGEFSYGTIGEGREVYALASHGRIVALTRQTIINDDLDAFTRVPAAFGAAAADLESDIVYGALIQNPVMGDNIALFAAAHGNVIAPAVIDEVSLAEGYRLFGNQRGLEGRQISILPRYIITPPGRRSVEARKNVTATTPLNVAGVNAFANRLEPIEEPRLIPAAGPDPWFLAADPARVDTVEYAYLEGQEGVFIETRTGFEVDGLEIKARHDFVAKAIDWRGLARNVGV